MKRAILNKEIWLHLYLDIFEEKHNIHYKHIYELKQNLLAILIIDLSAYF